MQEYLPVSQTPTSQKLKERTAFLFPSSLIPTSSHSFNTYNLPLAIQNDTTRKCKYSLSRKSERGENVGRPVSHLCEVKTARFSIGHDRGLAYIGYPRASSSVCQLTSRPRGQQTWMQTHHGERKPYFTYLAIVTVVTFA
ncbi:hypothetical protein JTE90_025877 [Oedothorax gibbosus]|uniref:Uncharacterized protein n=1 Tax=Oedothorax gibbosus TaxID=931172 RepID=A0AAV6UL36_9ARAC|nr:hypothetical protein JTE90_025877 [Oedothorax gibbosus]